MYAIVFQLHDICLKNYLQVWSSSSVVPSAHTEISSVCDIAQIAVVKWIYGVKQQPIPRAVTFLVTFAV